MRWLLVACCGCGFTAVKALPDAAAPDLAAGDLAAAFDLAAPLDQSSTGKRVFTTRATVDGNLGGVLLADTLCTTTAQRAGLGGAWRAWLSDSQNAAIDRVVGTGPWYRLDGARAFVDHSALASWPQVRMELDEHGVALPIHEPVWTGTQPGGSAASETCLDWTSIGADGRAGETDTTDDTWTFYDARPCSVGAHLYCFEQ
jgi:hypothetical protein